MTFFRLKWRFSPKIGLQFFDCNQGWKFQRILAENRATFLIWWVSPNLSLSWLELQWYLADTLFLRFLAFFEPVFRALLDNVRKCRIYEKTCREKWARDAEDEPGCQTWGKKVSFAKTEFSGKFAAICRYELKNRMLTRHYRSLRPGPGLRGRSKFLTSVCY